MAGKALLLEEDETELEPADVRVYPKDREDEDEEEDEEGVDEYERNGFIVDDVDEDEKDAEVEYSDDEPQKKKKRKKRELENKYLLDEDDYELLQDNNITGFRRPKVEIKKFKRLKKARDDARFPHGLSWEDEGPHVEGIEKEEQPREEEDEMADFIVDEDEDNEHGEPIRRRRKVSKKKSRWAPGVSSTAIQEARDIFGDVDELLRQRKLVLERISRYNDIDEKEKGLAEDEFDSLRKRKSIKINTNQVFLNRRESNLRNARYKTTIPHHYEDRDKCESETQKASKAKPLNSRIIVHPRFQNTTAEEAIKMLSVKAPGEIIVRPSSRGLSYLNLTLKIYDDVYAHKLIIEGAKEHGGFINKLRLGKTLKIGEDVFDDLDELIDRYVDPLVSHLKTMLGHRKFNDGVKTEVDEILRKEKGENPSRIVYSFGISHEHPGKFIFTYIRSSNLHHEYVGLYPKGFMFRNKIFDEIDRLVAYFQRHIDDPRH